MSLAYTLRESFSGFTRTKLSSFLSILTISTSLLLLGLFAVISINTARVIETIRSKVEMEAFMQEPASDGEILAVTKAIAAIPGVEQSLFISKDEAARIFKQEFGEDVTTVLDFNPLPPSFRIFLREGHRTAAGAQAVYDRLVAIKGIEGVTYRKALLDLIDRRTATIHNVMLGLGILISLSAIFLVSNTIRLAIYAKRKLIRTMELVGATPGFIRLPFLLEGIIQGLLGGALASAVLYALLEYVVRLASAEFAPYTHMETLYYILLVVAGTLLGLIGSVISVARFLRRKEGV
jgi:cell division transport system permease protein